LAQLFSYKSFPSASAGVITNDFASFVGAAATVSCFAFSSVDFFAVVELTAAGVPHDANKAKAAIPKR
jgi:hypothetical protein